MRLDLSERIIERVDLLAVVFVSEQVGLDGATRFHWVGLRPGSGHRNFTKGQDREVSRGALWMAMMFD